MVDWRGLARRVDLGNAIICIILLVLLGLSALTPQNYLFLPENDSSSSYPHPESFKVPDWSLIIIYPVIVIGTLIISKLLAKYLPNYFNSFKFWPTIWSFFMAVEITTICTLVFKNYVGRPRPDFYAVCGKGDNHTECKKDQYRSWPSGHASSSLSVTLYMGLLMEKAINMDIFIGPVICSLYVILGIYIGCTRIVDFRHRPDDVIAGFFVGFVFTLLVWNQTKDRLFAQQDKQEDVDNAIPQNVRSNLIQDGIEA